MPDGEYLDTAQLTSAAADEIELLRAANSILGEKLIAAVGVARDHGATDWVEENYPDFPAFERLEMQTNKT
ncbi:MAG: hypothetical protein JJ902_04145 [Roseibium sp.]|nr:hypothetical protein [Roseibium sp.]